jgi:hypothetical protein
MIAKEKILFFKWYQNFIIVQTNTENINSFFQTSILPNSSLSQELTMEELTCFKIVFLIVNESLCHLTITNRGKLHDNNLANN